MDLKLKLELLPETSWNQNLRSYSDSIQMAKVIKIHYVRKNYTCEICGSMKGEEFKKFDCHEVWKFNEIQKVQKLIRLQALCFLCHNVKHFGYAESQDWIDKEILIKHFLNTNKVSREIFDQHLSDAGQQLRNREEIVWDIQFQDTLEKYKDIIRFLSTKT